MFRFKVGLLAAVVLVLQAILLSGSDAAAAMRSMGGQYESSYDSESSSTQYARESMQQASSYGSEMASGAASAIGGGGYSAGGFANSMSGSQQSQMMRSKEITTSTTTTTTTTVKAVDYIQSNFAEVGSKSMGFNDDKDAMILKSFCEKDNGGFLPSLVKEPCNRKLIAMELGLNVNVNADSLLNYFKKGLYLKEKKIHKAALALKRCRINTTGYHKSLVSKAEVLNHIGMTFTNSKSNSQEMMKQWHEFMKYKNGLYFQSFFQDQEMWGELASQIGYTGTNAEDFKVYLLRNRFRKEKKTCKIAKCMRTIRKKHCGGKCAKGPKPMKRSQGGCGGKGKGVGVNLRVNPGCGGGCGGKCGKCGK